jgi:hypothetical protein
MSSLPPSLSLLSNTCLASHTAQRGLLFLVWYGMEWYGAAITCILDIAVAQAYCVYIDLNLRAFWRSWKPSWVLANG